MSSSWPYSPDNPDQQDRADEAGNQVADPSPQGDPEVTQNGAGNRRTDNAEHNIHDQPHVTLHERADLAKEGFEKALTNMRELAEMATKSQKEAFDVVRKRIEENVEGIRNLGKKAGE